QVQLTPLPVAITAHPVSQSVDSGANVTFNVTASGTPPLTYQWLYNGDDLPNGNGVSGATTASLTLTSVQPTQAGLYSVVVSGPLGSLISSNATLGVNRLVSLGEALDATNLTWTTSGSPPWIGQVLVSHDGQDAARSGAVSDGNTTTFL